MEIWLQKKLALTQYGQKAPKTQLNEAKNVF